MLIVEGPDFSGKTTLIAALLKQIRRRRWQRKYKWPTSKVHHHTKPPPDHNYELEYIGAAETCVISDRFALSELVYGPLFRSGVAPQVTPHMLRQVARMVLSRGGVQAVLSADEPTVTARIRERGKDVHVQSHEDYVRLIDAYRGVLDTSLSMGRPGLPTMVMDSSDDDPAVFKLSVSSLMESWGYQLDRARVVAKRAPGWGSLNPRMLLVGQPNTWNDRRLSAALDDALIGEKWIRFMLTEDATVQSVAWLAPRVVVALDYMADSILAARGIEHSVFHPGDNSEALASYAWSSACV
jgi:hypothetical protein